MLRSIFAALCLVATAGPALAMPAVVAAPAPAADAGIVQVYGGCGPYGHRGPYGGCRAGGQAGFYRARPCPPGFHLGGGARRCWPNR